MATVKYFKNSGKVVISGLDYCQNYCLNIKLMWLESIDLPIDTLFRSFLKSIAINGFKYTTTSQTNVLTDKMSCLFLYDCEDYINFVKKIYGEDFYKKKLITLTNTDVMVNMPICILNKSNVDFVKKLNGIVSFSDFNVFVSNEIRDRITSVVCELENMGTPTRSISCCESDFTKTSSKLYMISGCTKLGLPVTISSGFLDSIKISLNAECLKSKIRTYGHDLQESFENFLNCQIFTSSELKTINNNIPFLNLKTGELSNCCVKIVREEFKYSLPEFNFTIRSVTKWSRLPFDIFFSLKYLNFVKKFKDICLISTPYSFANEVDESKQLGSLYKLRGGLFTDYTFSVLKFSISIPEMTQSIDLFYEMMFIQSGPSGFFGDSDTGLTTISHIYKDIFGAPISLQLGTKIFDLKFEFDPNSKCLIAFFNRINFVRGGQMVISTSDNATPDVDIKFIMWYKIDK